MSDPSFSRDAAPFVTVVIPTFNRAGLVGNAIRSVLEQTIQNLEVIVVDDRSTDDTKVIVEGFRDPRLRYEINRRPRGPSGARNTGILTARGEWIGFLDSDDEWLPSKLELQVRALERSPEAQVISCGWRWSSRTTGRTRLERMPDAYGKIEGHPRWFFNICQDILVRREPACDTLFPEDLHAYECLDWLIRLQQYHCLTVPDILVNCYDHEGPRASDGALKCLYSLERVLRQHQSFLRGHPSQWAALNEKLGTGLLVADGDHGKARSYLLNTIRAKPTRVRAWGYLLLSRMPFGQRIRKSFPRRQSDRRR